MKQYLDLVRHIIDRGTLKASRTGVPTLSCFSLNFRHDMAYGFPLLTTKHVNWQAMIYELLWFLSGEPGINLLKPKTGIWNAWADESGKLDTAYGYFHRQYPALEDWAVPGPPYAYTTHPSDEGVASVDQVSWVMEELVKNPDSRRLVVNAWYPPNAICSKLPPCHMLYVLNVQDGRLCLHMTQRSCDFALGVPFNIASYALLLLLYARWAGLQPGVLAITFVDAHVYHVPAGWPDGGMPYHGKPLREHDHVAGLTEQLARDVRPLPTLELIGIKDFRRLPELHLKEGRPLIESFVLRGYDPHPAIAFNVAV